MPVAMCDSTCAAWAARSGSSTPAVKPKQPASSAAQQQPASVGNALEFTLFVPVAVGPRARPGFDDTATGGGLLASVFTTGGFRSYIASRGDDPVIGAGAMSKGMERKKETKKKPQKSKEEKRAEKRAKQAERGR